MPGAVHRLEVADPVLGLTPTGSVTFIGNATVVMELGGLKILTDPNFLHQGEHAKLGGVSLPAEALELIDPDVAIPIHFDDYTVMKSPLADFDRAVARRNLRTEIRHLDRGERFSFDLNPPL